MKKKIIIASLILIVILVVANKALASGVSDIVSGADGFISANNGIKVSEDALKNTSDTIYNVLMTIGVVSAIIVGIVLGIKYMTSASSEQAKVKETMIPYLVGCVVLFGAFGIWKLVVNVLQSVGK